MKNIDKIKNLLEVELTDIEAEQIDKWYSEHPSCTHAAFLSIIKEIKGKDMNELMRKRKEFFYSLPSKVFVSKKGFCVTFYVFDKCDFAYSDYDGWSCETIKFEIVGERVISYNTGKIYVTMANCSMFETMKESSIDEIDEISGKIYKDIKDLIS